MSESKLYQFPRTRMTIPLEGIFKNKKGKRQLFRVSDGQTSIEASEQDKDSEKSYLTVVTNPMKIEDENTIEFIELMIADGANIREYKPAKIAADKNKISFATIDILYKVKNSSMEDLIPVAYASLGKAIYNKSPEEIIDLMLAFTQENHEQVQEFFEDKTKNKLRYFVAGAFGNGIIEEGYDGGQVDFNGEKITAVGKGESAIDAVADYFDSKEGKADYHLVAQALAEKFKGEANEAVAKKPMGRPKAVTEEETK